MFDQTPLTVMNKLILRDDTEDDTINVREEKQE